MIRGLKYPKPVGLSILLTSILLMILGGCSNKGGETMKLGRLIPDKYDSWSASSDIQQYNRETIFDYIDGAGEVYLMYGFKDVAVKTLFDPDSVEITVEVFDMGRPDDAFGIFSHSREGNDIGVGGGSEYRDGYLCFWKDRYFVCVYAYKTSDRVNNAVIGLGKEIAAKITGIVGPPEMVKLLPAEGMRRASEVYFHLQTSLNYHYYLSEENILHLSDSTDAVLAVYDPGRATLVCVKYPDSSEAKNAYDNFISNYIPDADESGTAETEKGKWVRALYAGRYFVAAFDAPERESAVLLVDNVKNKIGGLGDD